MELTKNTIKNLKDKKYRKEQGIFFVEGEKFCLDLLSTDIEIIMTIGARDYNEFPNFCKVDKKVIEQLANTVTPQDILCVCRAKFYDIDSTNNSLVLDNLQDPGNVGTLIRSAVAFGFNDIYLVNCADPYSEKVVRSSAGNIIKERRHKVAYTEVAKNKDKIADKFIVADMLGTPIGKIHLPKSKIAVIIGNEGSGVSADFLALADTKISIPMLNGVESLNAGVAGSIIMQKISEV